MQPTSLDRSALSNKHILLSTTRGPQDPKAKQPRKTDLGARLGSTGAKTVVGRKSFSLFQT